MDPDFWDTVCMGIGVSECVCVCVYIYIYRERNENITDGKGKGKKNYLCPEEVGQTELPTSSPKKYRWILKQMIKHNENIFADGLQITNRKKNP